MANTWQIKHVACVDSDNSFQDCKPLVARVQENIMRKALRPVAAYFCAPAGLFISLGLLGCTSTPSIEVETKAVPISEIVERVKCEIWQATKERLADPDFAFLNKWDATVDLTLMINEQSYALCRSPRAGHDGSVQSLPRINEVAV
jgi:hypothetical protein